ncbi:MAG: DUF559 domain-containing protein [Acidimicrobiales bacterium]
MRREALARLAGHQYGAFARRQARQVGLTAKEIEGGARRGEWDRIYRGVYRMAGAPTSQLQSLFAAVLAGGPGAMATHLGAAWLWDLTDDLHIEVGGPQQRVGARGLVVYRSFQDDVRPVVRRRIPCTDPLRTVIDVAGSAGRQVVEGALDRGIAKGLFTVSGIEAALERRSGKGVAGVRLLRACLAERLDDGGERTSCLESPMDRLLVRQRLPLPERQFWLPGRRYRLDYAWPAARLAVEVDGYESHSDLEAFRSDRERQNVLVLLGWTVLRFTWADVRNRPARVADQVRRALAAGETTQQLG